MTRVLENWEGTKFGTQQHKLGVWTLCGQSDNPGKQNSFREIKNKVLRETHIQTEGEKYQSQERRLRKMSQIGIKLGQYNLVKAK